MTTIIKSLYIDSYRGFKNFTIDFNKKVNILVGTNGIGKSTIISLLRGVFNEVYYGLDRDSMEPSTFTLFTFEDITFSEALADELVRDKNVVVHEIKDSYIDTVKDILSQYGKKNIEKKLIPLSTILNKKVTPIVSLNSVGINRNSYIIYNNFVYEISFNEQLREKAKKITLDFSDNNFILNVIRKSESDDSINLVINKFISQMTNSINKKLNLTNQQVVYEDRPSLKPILKNSSGKPHDKLSSGESQLEKLIFFNKAIEQNYYKILLLDEPEIHLNYGQMLIFSEIVEKILTQNSQIFIATHSSYFLKTSNANYIKYINYNESGLPQLSTLSASELRNTINYPELFFSKSIVLVEDLSDKVFYERTLNVINRENNGLSFFKNNIEFIDVHGKSSFKKVINFCKKHYIKYKIISDFDLLKKESDYSYLPDKDIQNFKEKLQKVSKKSLSTNLLKTIPKKDVETILNLLVKISDNTLDIEQFNIENNLATIIEKISYDSVIIKNLFEKKVINQILKTFEKNHTWVLKDGTIDDYVNSELKKKNKLHLEKLNEIYYPENIDDVKKFIPKTKLNELKKLSDYIYN